MMRSEFNPSIESKTGRTWLGSRGAGRGSAIVSRAISPLWVVVFSSLISIGLWAAHRDEPLLRYLVVGNGIGLSASALNALVDRIWGRRFAPVPRIVLITPISVIAGVELAAYTVGGVRHLIGRSSIDVWLNYGTSFVIAGIACALAAVGAQALRMRASLEIQRREAAELRQSETAARLALLQAQIEPHFLFNTLANVQSLIERDPKRAASMLDSLNRYLRGSLKRTRDVASTLDDELQLVEALLNIAAIRLGDRLRYGIDVPDLLRRVTLAPLLLQPLVENALLHGIEPSIEGGDIRIVGRQEGDMLMLDVIDTGVGLSEDTKLHGGVGLANVRARLASLYGERGHLTVTANASAARGVTANLAIPLADMTCPPR